MRKCPNPKCGFIVENDQALFCKKCGTRLPAFVPEHADESVDESVGERAEPAATAPDEPVSFQKADGGEADEGLQGMSGYAVTVDHQDESPADDSRIYDIGDDGSDPQPPPLPFEPQKKPDNHLLKAILSTVLCIPLIGLVAIVYAAQVDSCYSQGFYDEAMEKSRRANAWGNAAIIVGLVIYFVVFVFFFFMMYYVGDSSYSDYDYNY